MIDWRMYCLRMDHRWSEADIQQTAACTASRAHSTRLRTHGRTHSTEVDRAIPMINWVTILGQHWLTDRSGAMVRNTFIHVGAAAEVEVPVADKECQEGNERFEDLVLAHV